MTHYEDKYFNVEMKGRDPKTCNHGWVNDKNICVFCGAEVCERCGGDGQVQYPSKDDPRETVVEQCPNPKCVNGFWLP